FLLLSRKAPVARIASSRTALMAQRSVRAWWAVSSPPARNGRATTWLRKTTAAAATRKARLRDTWSAISTGDFDDMTHPLRFGNGRIVTYRLHTVKSPRGLHAQGRGVPIHGHPRGEAIASGHGGPRVLVVGGDDGQHTTLAVRLEVHARDEVLAGQHGQAVVAVDALRRRLEDLEQCVEPEQP